MPRLRILCIISGFISLSSCTLQPRQVLILNERTYQVKYGEPWPLKAKEGNLYCRGNKIDPEVVLEAEGMAYAVNGNAIGKRDEPSRITRYININEIRKDHPAGRMYGLMSVSPMIEEGLKLCPEK